MSMLSLLIGASLAQSPAEPTVASAATASAAGAAAGEQLIRGIPPGPPPPPETVEQTAREIGLQLRCLQCQNESIADSNSNMAKDSLALVRRLVAAGYSEEQIKDHFVESYGEGILLLPNATGLNLVVYIGPAIGAGLALGLVLSTVVQWRKEEDDVPLPSDVGLAPKDRYEQRLLAELED